jgi:hypothetical protein
LRADIWQAEANSAGSAALPITSWTKITTATPSETLAADDGFVYSALTPSKNYVFRVVLASKDGDNAEKTVSNPASSDGTQPSMASPSSFTWTEVTGTAQTGLKLSGLAVEVEPLKKQLEGVRVFVMKEVSSGVYERVTSVSPSIIAKTSSAITDPVIEAHYYYVLFLKTGLSALKDAANVKPYYLVTEDSSGGYASCFSSFTVDTDGKVEWKP